MHNDDKIGVELLRGGRTRQLKLPDANSVPIHYISASDLSGRVDDTPS